MGIWSETGNVFNNRDDNYNLPTIEELLRGFATKDPSPNYMEIEKAVFEARGSSIDRDRSSPGHNSGASQRESAHHHRF